jgi:LysR family transcriptional regulator of beta-lactamase
VLFAAMREGATVRDWTCTLRRDTDAWLGYAAETPFPSVLMPVCTPAIAASLRHPCDLRDATLIIVAPLPNEWSCWFEAAGQSLPIRPAGEMLFESNAMAMQAVLDGVWCRGQLACVSDALAAGRLVAPFPIVAHRRETWFLEYRPVREDPALLAFRDWLLGEAERRQRSIEIELWNGSLRLAAQKRRSKSRR